MESYYVRLSQCLGLDPARAANLEHPHVLIVNRQKQNGRSFGNIAEAHQILQKAFPRLTIKIQQYVYQALAYVPAKSCSLLDLMMQVLVDNNGGDLTSPFQMKYCISSQDWCIQRDASQVTITACEYRYIYI